MKLIIAVVRPFLIDRIIVALEDVENFPGATVLQAEGFGQRLRYTRDDMLNPLHPIRQIEIIAPDEMVEQIVTVVRDHARTGKKGDGIIFVVALENIVSI